MLVKATYPFYLVRGGHIYMPGEQAEVSGEQAERLVRRGLAEAARDESGPGPESESDPEPEPAPGRGDIADDEDDTPDLSDMTVAQLRATCEAHGIDAPRRATKAQLIALLTEG